MRSRLRLYKACVGALAFLSAPPRHCPRRAPVPPVPMRDGTPVSGNLEYR